MTNALAIPDKAWLSMRGEASSLQDQLRRTIPLGVFKIMGLEHIDSPTVTLAKFKAGTELDLLCQSESVSVRAGDFEIGILPVREGKILTRLMAGGKKLVAKVHEISVETIFPRIEVSVSMEEF